MLDRGVRSPRTSSCGRWFDAAAGLLDIKPVSAFEGQAAMLLEGLAEQYGAAAPLAGGYTIDSDNCLDIRPVIEYVAESKSPAHAAAVFHATLAVAFANWAVRAATSRGIAYIALAGGCFANRVLATALGAEVAARGLTVLEAAQVPPGDGGLSLGQAWVALLASQES
jgi:hydrogenase maturation protein HypF